MKLHLPVSLRKSLVSVLAALGAFAPQAFGSGLHADASMTTYVDFGQNRGRYVVGNTNALLDYLNKDGVTISYTGGQADYTLLHGMIDFSSQRDSGEGVAIGYNFYATVQHNGVHNNTFTGNYIGSSNAIHYQSIEYRSSENNAFLLTPSNDYKISRQNKLITDVTGSTVYGATTGDYSAIENGEWEDGLIYRAASGMMYRYDHEGNKTGEGWQYIVGGIMSAKELNVNNAEDGALSIFNFMDPSSAGINETDPLPYVSMPGDSGSPAWVWNSQTEQYEYIAGDQSGNEVEMTQYQGAPEWTNDTMNSFNKEVLIGADNTVYLNATTQTDTVISDSVNGVSTTLWQGTVTDGSGKELASFIGVEKGINTWNDLSVIKDTDNWYNYDNTVTVDGVTYQLFNATEKGDGADLSYADLFNTENLVFKASSSSTQNVVVNETVDLGIGYVHFTKGEQTSAVYVVSSVDGAQLNSAGYVVDAGVDVHLQVTNSTDDIMREWRKVGEGNLYLEGQGDNNILLNVGGQGATYLNQQGGYAAYNVLANNGTTVVIGDINQIARDFTFGFRGGVLDMNGHSMTWNNDATDVSADGFTIHALDEGAIITNTSNQAVTLTWTQGGAQTWLGSFKDTAEGALKFVYAGNGTLTMTGIYTNLLNHADSGIEVSNGAVILQGTNTVHGTGWYDGWWNSYSSVDDWHYADMAANVTVASGASFELGSHARLTGDVSVADGGVFIMREGVKHEFEYIEGGSRLESTYAIADYYGLKGNVTLAQNAVMKVIYSEGTTANNTYAGNISGAGSFYADLGSDGGRLTLTGDNSFSGAKELVSGGLTVDGVKGLGDISGGNLWLIGNQAWMAVNNAPDAQTLLTYVDGRSQGVLALTADVKEALDMSNHAELIIGAAEGHSVHYGTADQTLSGDGGNWILGGGGGELVVDFKLSGSNGLILGNEYGHGTVTLTNDNNDFTGNIVFKGGVTLLYTSLEALGDSSVRNVQLAYSDRIQAMQGISAHVTTDSRGVLLIDNAADINLNLSTHEFLYVGSQGDAVFNGSIQLAQGQAYRFGGITGTMTLNTQLESGHNLIVDGQTYTGGKLVLASAQTNLDGFLTLTGYNPDRTQYHYGDITLSFAPGVDNALTGLTSAELKDGGILDLAGTAQTLNNVVAESGSLIVDSVGGGVLTLTGENVLGGMITAENLTLQSGTVRLDSDQSISSVTVLTLAEGTLLDVNGHFIGGALNIEGAGATVTNSGSAAANIAGNVNLGTGATLTLTGGRFATESAQLGGEGATIDFQAQRLEFLSSATQTVKGAMVFNTGASAELYSDGNADNATRIFDHLQVASGVTLNLTESSWNTVWNIHRLSGEGDVVWSSTGTHWYSSRLILDGENDFSGTLTLNRNFPGSEQNRSYAAYVELAHDKAAHQATLSLQGADANNVASLAVNADNAQVKGLAGNEFSYLYAGAAHVGGGSGNENMGSAPTATRQATLTITGAEAQSFNGQVGTANDGSNGLRLVMAGAGAQTFSGASINLASLEAQTGTLILNADGLNVTGDIAIMQGGTLQLGTAQSGVFAAEGGSLSLNAGNSLTVTAAADAHTPATLNGTLILNGGELNFSGNAMLELATGEALLSSGTVNTGAAFGGQQTVNFYDTSTLTVGTYQLATGDWSAVSEDLFFSESLGDYMNAAFSTADGLTVTLSAKEGTMLWNGTAEAGEWTATNFGQQTGVPGSAETAVFTDAATNKNVVIAADTTVNQLMFDNEQAYTLTTGGGTAGAETLVKRGDGVTTLESGVAISGATVIDGGELVVKDAAMLKGPVSGEGTLTLDPASEEVSLTINNLTNLNIASGQFKAESVIGAQNIAVASGAVLSIGANLTQGGNLTLSDAGDNATLVLAEGAAFTGSMNLAGDAVMAINGADAAMLGGTLRSNGHTLTKTGDGTLYLSGSNHEYELFDVTGGKVLLGAGSDSNVLSSTGVIRLSNGAVLCLNGNGTKGNVMLAGGTLDAYQNGIDGKITVSGDDNYITANDGREVWISGGIELQEGAHLTMNGGEGSVMYINKEVTMTGDSARLTLNALVGSASGVLFSRVNNLTVSGNMSTYVCNIGSEGNMLHLDGGQMSVLERGDGATQYVRGGMSFSNGGVLQTAMTRFAAKEQTGSFSGANVSVDVVNGKTTIAAESAQASITGMMITQNGGRTLKLEGVLMDAASQISGGLVQADNLTLQVQAGVNAAAVAERTLSSGAGFTTLAGEIVTLERDVAVVDMLCSALVDTQLSGTSLTLDFSGLDAQTLAAWNAGDLLLSLSFGELTSTMSLTDASGYGSTTFNLDGMNVTAMNGSNAYNVYTTQADGHNTLYIGNLNVPEPSSASLGLLGLAAMLMRRRRK